MFRRYAASTQTMSTLFEFDEPSTVASSLRRVNEVPARALSPESPGSRWDLPYMYPASDREDLAVSKPATNQPATTDTFPFAPNVSWASALLESGSAAGVPTDADMSLLPSTFMDAEPPSEQQDSRKRQRSDRCPQSKVNTEPGMSPGLLSSPLSRVSTRRDPHHNLI